MAHCAVAAGWRGHRADCLNPPLGGADDVGVIKRLEQRSLPLVAAVAAFAIIPGAALEWANARPSGAGGGVHFGLVAAAALAATIASAVLSVAGARRRDGRTVLLGTAFSTM